MQSNNSLLSTITSNGLRFMIATTIEKNLWSLITKWSDDSASWKTNVRRQLALVTFATLALEQGGEGVTDDEKGAKTHTWTL